MPDREFYEGISMPYTPGKGFDPELMPRHDPTKTVEHWRARTEVWLRRASRYQEALEAILADQSYEILTVREIAREALSALSADPASTGADDA